MNNKLLVATKACMAAAFLACSVTAGQEGRAQTLNTFNQLNISGTSTFGLSTGEAFNIQAGNVGGGVGGSGIIQPFAVTSGSTQGGIVPAASTATVGNAGQSSLTVTFDRNGFLPIQEDSIGFSGSSTNVAGNGSVTAVAGITPFGGDALNGGQSNFNVPSRIILNQDSVTGVPGITITSFAPGVDGSGVPIPSADATLNGAGITQTLLGADSVGASVVATEQIINSLTVFE